MLQNHGLGFGLATAPLMTNAKTRSISAENPKGEVGAGGKEASNLDIARKGKPCITLKQGETVTLIDVDGPGVIQHFWITVTDRTDKGYFVLRDLVIRMYWDDEDAFGGSPSRRFLLQRIRCQKLGQLLADRR
ncbi:hypothetical protein [Paenibacillus sp. R14(2021)]|uniref:hypothetical protein n=1 Tax=Paenibacillus sp. R14(2021) TaxID=2859228 RepID=UPI00215847BC|nr:hypothetical protein [Paenibacillus sp. R14(2021)]